MIGILKFIRGYVQIKVWGFAPERFLNLCSSKNILLWDIRRDGDIYYMCISLSGFKQLKAIARKTKIRTTFFHTEDICQKGIRCGIVRRLPVLVLVFSLHMGNRA